MPTTNTRSISVIRHSGVSDYYPFGMQMQGREFAGGMGYRWGFQNQEMDNEIRGNGNAVNYTFRMHNPRIGRFDSLDPLSAEYPWNAPFVFSENRVTTAIELEGLEAWDLGDEQGVVFGPFANIQAARTSTIENQNPVLMKEVLIKATGGQAFIPVGPMLSSRPDADGYISYEESISWWRNGNGQTLRADLGKLSINGITAKSFKNGVGSSIFVNTIMKTSTLDQIFNTKAWNDAKVYGTIRLTLMESNRVTANYDDYNFEMHSSYNPVVWIRNLATKIGKSKAGVGKEYRIEFYGSLSIPQAPLPAK